MIKRLLWVLCITSAAQAMVFDNRFLPLLLKPHERRSDTQTYLRFQPFFLHADKAFNDGFDLEIPDLGGSYDLRTLEQGMMLTGSPPFLRSDFALSGSLLWNRRGRIDVQGLAFLYEQMITPWFSVGVNGLFAHVASRHEFFFTDDQQTTSQPYPQGTKEYLSEAKEQMHKELGICPALFSKTGFGDLDLYMRFGYQCDYTYKFRSIDAGLRVGVLAPTAKERDISNPASIPLGGNKHWGMYFQLEGQAELKEDMEIGLWFRASKRFKRTDCMRLPLCRDLGDGKAGIAEPAEYGILTGPVSVDPGWTFVFNPQFVLSHLRRGFGVKVYYTLISHLKDTLCDVRADQTLASDLGYSENASSWGSEYVTIGAFYDFGFRRECFYPQISLYWDIPVDWLVAKRAARTHSVSLMFEIDF